MEACFHGKRFGRRVYNIRTVQIPLIRVKTPIAIARITRGKNKNTWLKKWRLALIINLFRHLQNTCSHNCVMLIFVPRTDIILIFCHVNLKGKATQHFVLRHVRNLRTRRENDDICNYCEAPQTSSGWNLIIITRTAELCHLSLAGVGTKGLMGVAFEAVAPRWPFAVWSL